MNQEVKMKPSYLKIAFLDRDGTIIKDYPDEKWREIKEPEWHTHLLKSRSARADSAM